MKNYNVSLIMGDGTGPELANVTRKVIDSTGVKINWEIVEAGVDAQEKYGTPLPKETLESVRKNKVALKAPATTPIGTGFRSVNVAIRKELDLYACLRPCKTFVGVKSKFENIDLVVVRENTEDLYAGVEFLPDSKEAIEITKLAPTKIYPHSAISIKPISKFASERIVRYAFEYALKHKRRKVTAVSKANIMKYTDGLFFDTAKEVSKEFEGKIEYEERLIDNMCMQLVQKPELYDVIVLPNLYGDILSDLCAGLVGGLGVAPGANFGKNCAVFEAVHGSAPQIAGKNLANPLAMILSGVEMLKYLGYLKEAQRVEKGIEYVLRQRDYITPDLGGEAGTKEMTSAIIEAMSNIS